MAFRMNGSPVESGGPEDRLLPWDRVHDITGISRTTAWRLSQAGSFPSRVSVSPGRVGWWESELTAWKQARGSADPIDPAAKARRERFREPATRPRLPGMSRPAPMRPGPAPVMTHQADLLTQTGPPQRSAQKAAKGSAAADQTDFGF